MKALFILFISIYSISSFSNYAKIADLELGSVKTVYMKKCEDCMPIPSGYNSSYHVLSDEMIDDPSKPIYDKAMTDSCLDIADCDSKFDSKVCDQDYEKIKNYELLQVYCVKVIGYEKMPTGSKVVIEDPTKRALWESQRDLAISQEISKRDEILQLREKPALTATEIKKILDYLTKDL